MNLKQNTILISFSRHCNIKLVIPDVNLDAFAKLDKMVDFPNHNTWPTGKKIIIMNSPQNSENACGGNNINAQVGVCATRPYEPSYTIVNLQCKLRCLRT